MSQFEDKSKYTLEDRTLKFSKEIIKFCKACSKNIVTIPLVNQLIRSGTSIGANYREANGASSKRDFQNKIFICKKESKETLYWLNLLEDTFDGEQLNCKALSQEAKELVLIFGKIAYSAKE